MQARTRADRAPVLFLGTAFDEDTAAVGVETDRARAAFLGCGYGYYFRLRHGAVSPGGSFIARVLDAPWPDGPRKFEKYFRVVSPARAERALAEVAA